MIEEGQTYEDRCHTAEAQVAVMRKLLTQLLSDLPASRDWLDPALERQLRYFVGGVPS